MVNVLGPKETVLAEVIRGFTITKLEIAKASAETRAELGEGDTNYTGEMVFVSMYRGRLLSSRTVVVQVSNVIRDNVSV